MEDTASYWDSVYAHSTHVADMYDGWLDGIEISDGSTVLDMGCGRGRNIGYLKGRGAQVYGCDISPIAICHVRAVFEGVDLKVVDIRSPLPYQSEFFEVVVASLCLHYFDWQTTVRITHEISRVLKSSGQLVLQVNSDRDINFGAGSGEEIEAGYYCRDGHYKRFFDEAALRKLLEGWERGTLERRSLSTPSGTKHVFFAAVRKPES